MDNQNAAADKRFEFLKQYVNMDGYFTKENYPEEGSDPDGYYKGNYIISKADGFWAECYLHSFWNFKWWIKFLKKPNHNLEWSQMKEVNKLHKLSSYRHIQEFKDHFW